MLLKDSIKVVDILDLNQKEYMKVIKQIILKIVIKEKNIILLS